MKINKLDIHYKELINFHKVEESSKNGKSRIEEINIAEIWFLEKTKFKNIWQINEKIKREKRKEGPNNQHHERMSHHTHNIGTLLRRCYEHFHQ